MSFLHFPSLLVSNESGGDDRNTEKKNTKQKKGHKPFLARENPKNQKILIFSFGNLLFLLLSFVQPSEDKRGEELHFV